MTPFVRKFLCCLVTAGLWALSQSVAAVPKAAESEDEAVSFSEAASLPKPSTKRVAPPVPATVTPPKLRQLPEKAAHLSSTAARFPAKGAVKPSVASRTKAVATNVGARSVRTERMVAAKPLQAKSRKAVAQKK